MTETQKKSSSIDRLLPVLSKLKEYSKFSDAIESCEKNSLTYLTGLVGSLKGIFIAELFEQRKKQIIAVAPDITSAMNLWSDASIILGEEKLVFIGERHPRKHVTIQTLDSTFAENADVLRSLIHDPVKLVVTDADTFLLTFPSQKDIKENSIRLERFSSIKQDDLIKRIAYGGFERKEFVESSGDYSIRGGIVDIFPVGYDNPIRIEFFGDEIDSIREFDALSQRSIRYLDSVGFVTSLFLDEEDRTQGTMFDYFHNDALLFIDEISRVEQSAELLEEKKWKEIQEIMKMFPRVLHSIILPLKKVSQECHFDERSEEKSPPLIQEEISHSVRNDNPEIQNDEGERTAFIDFNALMQPAFNSAIRLLKENISELKEHHYDIFLIADSDQQARRLEELIAEPEDENDSIYSVKENYPVHHIAFSSGFIIPEIKLVVYTEHEIFNRIAAQRKTKKGFKGISLREMRQLHIGDFVVHVDKGIGKFAGFQSITVHGGKQETAKIIYADNDVLYVNLNYINRLQKFSSQEGQTPKLNKLGSAEWDRIKARAKKRLKDIARDLIQIYAKRKMAKGFAFTADSHWQREMEASFLYEDTPDQAKATEEVKKDMQQAIPMDRLICGDVGYGKTEVAVRAAFKAVLDGKQVAVLVPTTILAQQHYNTFQDRLHRYSVHVESISRFKTTAEQKEILARLKSGNIDVIIGTHRLLSVDVEFKNLGLLVIDEEHRFGVGAKEKLRKLRSEIDTLTLTATPIPRTLNFSLLGARDLSIIETPPRNRLPIMTDIVPFSFGSKEYDAIIREGMERELARSGQAYFVHDRVSDIELIAEKIRRINPKLRIGVAHGKMNSSELERVMMRFVERKYDLLVCTKIIESGLDIPNANTIFINRTDRFGLAELYQLRGRVGRSNIQAYAYLLIPKESKLSRTALKRLQAIEEFTELGTGFQLAMRDMEIRGAGNLLGAEQSGFISEIGFDLYMKTLEEAVEELKHQEFSELFGSETKPKIKLPDVVMELGIDAYLPNTYIQDATERFDYYKRLYNVETDENIKIVEQELIDRFGLPPTETESLFTVVRLRLIASRIHLARVTWDRNQLTLVFPSEDDEEFYSNMFQKIVEAIMKEREKYKLEQDTKQLRLVQKDVIELVEVENSLRWLFEITANQHIGKIGERDIDE